MLIEEFMPGTGQHSALAETVSFSVDCDFPAQYVEDFAPDGTVLERDVESGLALLGSLGKVFSKLGIQSTLFCIAEYLENEDCRAMFKSLAAQGHEIGNHSYSHLKMNVCGAERESEDIKKAHETIVDSLNIVPVGYRAPAYFCSEKSLETLAALGYLYDASPYCSRSSQWAYRCFKYATRKGGDFGLPRYYDNLKAGRPFLVFPEGGGQLVQWPLSSAWGLSFVGTLHLITPKMLFYVQAHALLRQRRHVHYSLHLIDMELPDVSQMYSWLPTVSNRFYLGERDNRRWLETRLVHLMAKRRVVTLGKLSEMLVGTAGR